jgi:hypothetical protein
MADDGPPQRSGACQDTTAPAVDRSELMSIRTRE